MNLWNDDNDNEDPILGRSITWSPSSCNQDEEMDDDAAADGISEYKRLVVPKRITCLKSEHTRWYSSVRDQPLRMSVRATETDATAMDVSSCSSSSGSRRRRPLDHGSPLLPPRKPIRADSRNDVFAVERADNRTVRAPQRQGSCFRFVFDSNQRMAAR